MSANPFAIALASFVSPMLGGAWATLQQGKLAAQSAVDKAQAAKIEGEMYKLRATQTAELSRQQLDQTLGTIDSIRAARGMNLDSATGQAIQRQSMQNAYRNEAVSVLGSLNQASASQMASAGYSMTAKWAIPLAAAEAGSNAGKQAMTAFAGGG